MEYETVFVLTYAALFVALLLTGFPIAYVLAGTAMLFAVLGTVLDWLGIWIVDVEVGYIGLTVSRVFGLMSNFSLVAVPMFVYMGAILDSSGIGEDLLGVANRLLRRVPGGLAIAVVAVGTVLAASTGIAAASILMLGAIAIPTLLRKGYHGGLSAGTVCVAGGLGSIIPPSIMLVIMADQMAVSVGDLFVGSLIPGLFLAGLYTLFLLLTGLVRPQLVPTEGRRDDMREPPLTAGEVLRGFGAPMSLIFVVLGSIFMGVASPTEAGGMGAFGALVLSFLKGRLSMETLRQANRQTARTTSVIFAILIGATCFSLLMRGFGGDDVIQSAVLTVSDEAAYIVLFILMVVFLLGFLLDWIEISLILLPLSLPIVTMLDINPVWFTVLVAMTLQTSFITPPVGFSLFYVRDVVPPSVTTLQIYRGIVPYVFIQLLAIAVVFLFPTLVTGLPALIYGR
ncbi:MAG: TRAP transporter large permease subunit [Alphaproteobacteria bacterium]|nr:TRAP transporter large permease subunit [Alphaproteobacteria bacterium]MBO6862576.1 TRAP transporter large permease subunit [Alphaproteobacteria bacterium]